MLRCLSSLIALPAGCSAFLGARPCDNTYLLTWPSGMERMRVTRRRRRNGWFKYESIAYA